MTGKHPIERVSNTGYAGYNPLHTSHTSHKTDIDTRDIRRNETTNVWRIRAADSHTGEIRYSRLFQQLHAAKRRAVLWRDLGYVVTVEVAKEVTFRQVWP